PQRRGYGLHRREHLERVARRGRENRGGGSRGDRAARAPFAAGDRLDHWRSYGAGAGGGAGRGCLRAAGDAVWDVAGTHGDDGHDHAATDDAGGGAGGYRGVAAPPWVPDDRLAQHPRRELDPEADHARAELQVSRADDPVGERPYAGEGGSDPGRYPRGARG